MKIHNSQLWLTTLSEKFISANGYGIIAVTGRAHCQRQVAFFHIWQGFIGNITLGALTHKMLTNWQMFPLNLTKIFEMDLDAHVTDEG